MIRDALKSEKNYKVGLLATHPIQYYVPWYRELAKEVNLKVYFSHKQTASGQADAGYGVEFEWDIPLTEGYDFEFLKNESKNPGLSSFAGCDTPSINEIIRDEKFDAFIVQGWFVKSYCQSIWACWRTGTPVLVRGDSHLDTRRSFARNLVKYPLYRLFIPRFDGYLVVGKRSERYYLHYGANPKRLFPTPHSVDNDFFRERAEIARTNRGQIRQDWNIPKDAIVFLLVGRLMPMKRPLDFLQAIKSARDRNAKVYGLIVGDGQLRGDIEHTIQYDDLPVTLAGFLNQSEMPKAYAASDALVLASGEETWGLVVNEAMACGLPAIVSDKVGCSPDLIQAGKTGATYPCGSVDDLADLMVSWTSDLGSIVRQGSNAREWINRFSVQSALDGTLTALQAVAR